jgi:hypothetical protein
VDTPFHFTPETEKAVSSDTNPTICEEIETSQLGFGCCGRSEGASVPAVRVRRGVERRWRAKSARNVFLGDVTGAEALLSQLE